MMRGIMQTLLNFQINHILDIRFIRLFNLLIIIMVHILVFFVDLVLTLLVNRMLIMMKLYLSNGIG